jgi:hypothetical protein
MFDANQANISACNGRSHLQQQTVRYDLSRDGILATNAGSHVLFPHYQHTGGANVGTRVTFPQRLFHMMEDIDTLRSHLSHIISWHISDLTFVIHKPDDFVREVMPLYFRGQTKLSSFQRQLKNYGFQRYLKRKNREGMIYYHEDFAFRRDKPCLLRHIVLKSFKTTTTKNTMLSLLQMTETRRRVHASVTTSGLPEEPVPTSFYTLDSTPLPLSLENLGDKLLNEAATELLCILEEACDTDVRLNDVCLDDDFECQQHHDSLSRPTAQQLNPEDDSLESSLVEEMWSAGQAGQPANWSTV